MATSLSGLPKFIGLSAATYAGLTTKDPNALYFVYDAGSNGIIYRGENVYGETVKYVTEVPAAVDALKGVVYFNTTSDIAYVKSGTAMKPIGALIVGTISDSDTEQNSAVPNVGAVKAYVGSKISTVFVYKGVKETVSQLPLIVTTADETAGVGKTYYSRSGAGTEESPYQYTVLALAVGDTVPAGSFEGPKTGDLWCVKVGEDGQSAEYAWTRLAAADPSDYKWEKLGSTIDYTIFMQKKVGATVGDIALFDATGDTIDTGKKIGGETLSETPDANTVATELAVDTAIESEKSRAMAAEATKQARDTDAVAADAAMFDEYGNTIDAGYTFGEDTDVITASSSAKAIATEKAVAAAVKVEKDRAEAAEALKLDEIEGTNGNLLTVAESGAAVADSGKSISTATVVPLSSATSINKVANELEVAAAVEAADAAKQDKDKDAVADNVAVFDEYGNTIDSGASISTATTVPASTSTSANKLANELEVANLKESLTSDYQLRDKDAAENNVATINSDGDSEDSGFTFGSGTITESGALDTVVATEEAVIKLVNKLAWQTIE